MSHIKYQTGEGETERWSIDRENMRYCVGTKCPHMSFGTCLKSKCIIKRSNSRSIFKLIK